MDALERCAKKSVSAELTELLSLLKRVQSEDFIITEIKSDVAQLDWNKLEYIGEVYHSLNHFWSDSDLRAEDSEYADFQRSELAKLIMHLEQGDFDSAVEVSFLAAT